MATKVSIEDMASAVGKMMSDYANLADDVVKNAVKRTAQKVRKEISINSPVSTGKYGKSWTTFTAKEDSHALEIIVHSKNRYQLAHLLEHGHAKRGGGRTAAKPHIAPAE